MTIRIIGFVLTLTLATILAGAKTSDAQSVQLKIDAGPGPESNEYDLKVSAEDPRGIGALEMELVYEPDVLEFVELKSGRLLDDAMLDHKMISPGRVRIDFICSGPMVDEGELFKARFKSAGNGPTNLALESFQAWDFDDLFEMRVESFPAEVTLLVEANQSSGSEPAGEQSLLLMVIIAVVAAIIFLVFTVKLFR